MDEQQREAFEEAVERKKEAARAASERTARAPREELGEKVNAEDQTVDRGSQDERSIRGRSSGHGKKTADKWNQ